LTNVVRDGRDLVLVAEVAPHRRLETTRRYTEPFAAQLPGHLPRSVQAAAPIMHTPDLDQQSLVAERPRGWLPAPLVVSPIRGSGDLQRWADRLDPEPAAVLVDEGHQLFGGRGSSSRGKKADAPFRISLEPSSHCRSVHGAGVEQRLVARDQLYL
jgi:hypothetical protein